MRDTSVASMYEKLPIELALEQLAATSAPSPSLAPPAVCSNRSVIVDPLSAFGATAVAAMLSVTPASGAHHGSSWLLVAPVSPLRSTASFRVHGLLAWSSRSGRWWLFADGGNDAARTN